MGLVSPLDQGVPGYDRQVLAQEFSVTQNDSTQAVHSHNVLVELAHLDHDAPLVPFCGVRTHFILDTDIVYSDQGWEGAGVFG